MDVSDRGQEGGIEGAEGRSVKILGKFAFGNVLQRMLFAWFGWECVGDC